MQPRATLTHAPVNPQLCGSYNTRSETQGFEFLVRLFVYIDTAMVTLFVSNNLPQIGQNVVVVCVYHVCNSSANKTALQKKKLLYCTSNEHSMLLVAVNIHVITQALSHHELTHS